MTELPLILAGWMIEKHPGVYDCLGTKLAYCSACHPLDDQFQIAVIFGFRIPKAFSSSNFSSEITR